MLYIESTAASAFVVVKFRGHSENQNTQFFDSSTTSNWKSIFDKENTFLLPRSYCYTVDRRCIFNNTYRFKKMGKKGFIRS